MGRPCAERHRIVIEVSHRVSSWACVWLAWAAHERSHPQAAGLEQAQDDRTGVARGTRDKNQIVIHGQRIIKGRAPHCGTSATTVVT